LEIFRYFRLSKLECGQSTTDKDDAKHPIRCIRGLPSVHKYNLSISVTGKKNAKTTESQRSSLSRVESSFE
jgi:hypothetical protein